ncbi:MAG: rRNA maturation RNase YbeY [Bdellovibrionales bacterium]|nr:rRNA maturation RNase YbeY [Bdellovibrionales bacterium]
MSKNWHISTAVEGVVFPASIAAFESVALEILAEVDFSGFNLADSAKLSLLFTNDSRIRELNRAYRKKDAATDVLSFSLHEGEVVPFPSASIGDVVISVETAQRQAKERDIYLYQELLRLFIHGVLHLAGFDHENVSDEDANRMRAKEDALYDQYLLKMRSVFFIGEEE